MCKDVEIGGFCSIGIMRSIFFVCVGCLVYPFLVDDCGLGTAARWAVVHIQNDTAAFYQGEVQEVVVDLLGGLIPFGNQLVYKV